MRSSFIPSCIYAWENKGLCYCLPRSADWMSLSVGDHFVEVQCLWRGKEQIEVFENLREEETLHRVGLFFGHHTLQSCIALIGFTVFHKVPEQSLAHLQIRIAIQRSTV